jgi:hypothetical protein
LLVENLQNRVRAELERAGRDRLQVRNALRWLLFSLEMSARPEETEEYSAEYGQWLINCWCIALAEELNRAIDLEEYEWAGEIQLMLDEVQLAEDGVY